MILNEPPDGRRSSVNQLASTCRIDVEDTNGGIGENLNNVQLTGESLVMICGSASRKAKQQQSKPKDYESRGLSTRANRPCNQTTNLDNQSSDQEEEEQNQTSDGIVVVDVETGSDSPYSRSDFNGPVGSKESPPSSSSSGSSANCGLNNKSSPSTSSSSTSSSQVDVEIGNKCGKCQNHEIEISKKGHARDCPFKKCNCLKCRLLDARSDILQVISGKETKLKGTKKDPNCGFCQNHGVKILRKGHVRSCGFGQERHFKLDNCFDCEVHYIRNEVNRLQIKMRRAMKEDRTLSEEQRKTAREAITRDEVEKVCDMARLARKKRENILAQQAGGECSSPATMQVCNTSGLHSASPSNSAAPIVPKVEQTISTTTTTNRHQNHTHHNHQQLNQLTRQTGVWRPWSQHQVAAAMAAQHHQLQLVNHHQANSNHHHQQLTTGPQQSQHNRRPTGRAASMSNTSGLEGQVVSISPEHQSQQQANSCTNMITTTNEHHQQQQQLTSAITTMAMANQTYLMNSLQAASQHQQQQANRIMGLSQQLQHEELVTQLGDQSNQLVGGGRASFNQFSPPSTPPASNQQAEEPLQLTQRSLQEQQLFNTLFRLIVAQFASAAQQPPASLGGGGG